MTTRLIEGKQEFTAERIVSLIKDFRVNKTEEAFVTYPGMMVALRAITYAYMSGDNTLEIDGQGFLTACRVFGLDSPTASVTKRLAFYGNSVDIL